MKKIITLHILPALGSGGIENLLLNIYNHIDKERQDFIFASHGEDGVVANALINSNCKIYKLPSPKRSAIKFIRVLFNILSENSVDIIHVHQGFHSFPAMIVARIYGIKVRIAHNHFNSSQYGLFNKILLFQFKYLSKIFATHFIACSKESALAFPGKQFFTNKNFIYLKNGIELKNYLNSPSDAVLKEVQLSIGLKKEYTVLMVARFSPEKNHKFAFEVIAELSTLAKNYNFIFAGDGPLYSEYCKVAAEMTISDSVFLLGARADVPTLMKIADLIILPSIEEGFGIVALEAQVANKYCIASTAVSKDAKISELLSYVDLSCGPKIWAKKILEMAPYKNLNLKNVKNLSEYDINVTTKNLYEFYKSSLIIE